MGTFSCENCGADRVLGRVICSYGKAPCAKGLQKCVACGEIFFAR